MNRKNGVFTDLSLKWLKNWFNFDKGTEYISQWQNILASLARLSWKELATLQITYRARIFKLLRSPRIDSQEPIPPGCVDWRAGMTNLFGYSYSVPIDCLKIPALNSSSKHLTYQRSRNYIFFSIFTALNHGTIFTGYKRYVVRYYEINQRLITKDYTTYRHFILMKARPMQCMHTVRCM